MQKFPRRWDKITCINFLQRKIILNCIAYYELNTNRLSDKEYDDLSVQLVELQHDVDVLNDTQYGYCMYDFDGNTGFDLYDRLTEHDKQYLTQLAKVGLAMTVESLTMVDKSLTKKKKKGGLF